eukprot:CAMPEP_0169144886 /NCGR_PEP_ID=MMETSP1015-20121227/46555_1 /TAXON_ID=342587 /ORGANISM="Karlodinium micrum, Strain CCMP2283" /LENGTH=154 /DNA_ID=CAMNT_0009212315 /DNA_START=138 /DNA_END=600 /DNA_ORIENTATION=+
MGLKIRANNSDSKGMHARAGVFMGPYIAAAAEGNGSVVEVQARIMQGNTTYKPPRRRRRKPFIKWKQKWNLDRKKQHSKKYVTKFSTDFEDGGRQKKEDAENRPMRCREIASKFAVLGRNFGNDNGTDSETVFVILPDGRVKNLQFENAKESVV